MSLTPSAGLAVQALSTALASAAVAALVVCAPAIARRRAGVLPVFVVLALVVGALFPSGASRDIWAVPGDALVCALPALLTYKSFIGRLVLDAAVRMTGIAFLTTSVLVIAVARC